VTWWTGPAVPEGRITDEQLAELKSDLSALVGLKVDWLSIPLAAIYGFEPSQLAVMVNTLMDGALPQVTLLDPDDPATAERLKQLGLTKAPRDIGEREGYPDYVHVSGRRVELKGLFVDNPALEIKRTKTAREPSARLKENVTLDVVDPSADALLVAAAQLQEFGDRAYPVIVDIGVFSMVDCVIARDRRLALSPGKWFGKVPKVLTNAARKVVSDESELVDLPESSFETDTNFGKLNRIPHPPLVAFLQKHGYRTPQQRRWRGFGPSVTLLGVAAAAAGVLLRVSARRNGTPRA
jgi:hypothetical protein